MIRHALAVPCLAALVALVGAAGCAEEEPTRLMVTFGWEAEPTANFWVWVRVEERDDALTPGRILAGQGPVVRRPGEPVEVAFDGLSQGANRVVVVEARHSEDVILPVRWYGLSELLDLGPGPTSVDVLLRRPGAEVHPPSVQLLVQGEFRNVVSPQQAGDMTVRVRSSGAAALRLANDPSAMVSVTTASLAELGCTSDVDADGVTWDVCDIPGWDLRAGLGDPGDGLHTVYVWLIDAAGYASLVVQTSVLVDSTPPLVLAASVSPNPAADGDQVTVSLNVNEPIDEAASFLSATSQGDQPAPVFLGPERLGSAPTYRWVADLTHEHDGATVDFAVTLTDHVGNVSGKTPLTMGDGSPLVLEVSP